MTGIFKNNPFRDKDADYVLWAVSDLPPIELSLLSELLFFIREKEEEYFLDTFRQLLTFTNAIHLWNLLDHVWLRPSEKQWVKPLILNYLREQIYIYEEFNV